MFFNDQFLISLPSIARWLPKSRNNVHRGDRFFFHKA